MGLDIIGCWRGAYSAFNRWRDTIGKLCGVRYGKVMDDEGISWMAPLVDWEKYDEDHLMGIWTTEDDEPPDPIYYLLIHSDCGGCLYPQQSFVIANRIEMVMSALDWMPNDRGHIGNWRSKTQKFIDGLRNAANENKVLEFG